MPEINNNRGKLLSIILACAIAAASVIYAYGQLTRDVARNTEEIAANRRALDQVKEAMISLREQQAAINAGIDAILKQLDRMEGR